MCKIDFEEMVTMFSERLRVLAYSVIKDWYTAEDIVQEAFIKAYINIDSIQNKEKVGAWLSAITARTAIDFLRSEKRRNWVEAEIDFIEHLQFLCKSGRSTEEEVEIRLFKEAVHHSFLCLSNDYQQVLLLKIQYGLKEAEIASVLELKSSTVKTRLHRARKQLKRTLNEEFSA